MQELVFGGRDVAVLVLNFDAGWGLVFRSTLPVLDGLHSWSWRFREETNLVLLTEFEPRIVQPVS
jgi:hypothetical protein